MKVGDTSELQREIRHMRYERERERAITSHLSDIPPVSSPLSLFFFPFNCLCCYEERWRGRVSEIQSEREKQTPGVFLSILSNPSTDQYRYKPACGSLLPLVLNTVHGLLPSISTIIYWILEKSHSGLSGMNALKCLRSFTGFTLHVESFFKQFPTLTVRHVRLKYKCCCSHFCLLTLPCW